MTSPDSFIYSGGEVGGVELTVDFGEEERTPLAFIRCRSARRRRFVLSGLRTENERN